MAIERPQFRPVASPVNTVARPRQYQPGPQPVRPVLPVAPTPPQMPQRPDVDIYGQTTNGWMALASALSSVNPQLQTFITDYVQKRRETEGREADAAAIQMALRHNVTSWAEAVAKDPTLADKSPWYRQIYESRLAKTKVQQEAGRLMGEYVSSEIAGSDDPTAIHQWLSERLTPVMEQMSTPAMRQAAAEEVADVAARFMAHHTQVAVANLVNHNKESLSVSLGTRIDNFLAQHSGADRTFLTNGIAEIVWEEEALARAQGINGTELNEIVTSVVASKIRETGETWLKDAILMNRPGKDGKPIPGAGTSVANRNRLMAAEDAALQEELTRQNIAWTMEQRARARAADRITSEVFGSLIEQLESNPGIPPQMDPRLLAEAVRVDPDLGSKYLSFYNSLRSFAQEEDPHKVALAQAFIYSGRGTPEDVLSFTLDGTIKNPATVRDLYEQARQNQDNTILRHPIVTQAMQTLEQTVGNPLETGILAEPAKAAAAVSALRGDVLKWAEENPSFKQIDLHEFVNRAVERYTLLYNPSSNLPALNAQAAQVQSTTPNPAPAPQPAPQAPQAIQPRADLEWRRVPAFGSREELVTAFQQWQAGDVTGVFAQWVSALGFSTAEEVLAFVERQQQLLGNTSSQ